MRKPSLLVFLALIFILVAHSQITPTDYSNATNWASHPMKGSNDMTFDPSYTIIGADTSQKTLVTVPYNTNSNFDVFCVYATTVPVGLCSISSYPAQNFPVNDPCHRAAANIIIQNEFALFARFGRMFCPYYRQASLGAFSTPPTSATTQASIFDTAVTDVIAAFQYYMLHNNNGKRVILLGHSQGANILSMMLRKFESDPQQYPYLNKIFLAVLVGYEAGPFVLKNQLSGGWLQNFKICQNPLDTNCITTWGLHRYGSSWESIPLTNKIAYNASLKSKNYLYNTLDATIHYVLNDPLGYSFAPSIVGGAIFPNSSLYFPSSNYYNTTTQFVYYSNFYKAVNSKPDALNYGLLIDTTLIFNDKRFDPIGSSQGGDLHVYDMFLVIGDVINLINQKMSVVTSVSSLNYAEKQFLKIFPNPVTSGLTIDVRTVELNNSYLSIYSSLGKEVAFIDNPASVYLDIKKYNLSKGLYIVQFYQKNKNLIRTGRFIIQ